MAKKIVYLYETGNSIDAWTVPADWNSSDNTIECIGGGASGRNYNNGVWTGAGGGGGAYSKIANLTLTPGDSIAYSVGIHGQPDNPSSTSGKDTWFNGANLAGASVGAQAGQGPDNSSTGAGGAGGAASSGIGSTKYSGGSGGSSAGNYYRGNGAGGGAAGPNGDGGNGGSAFIGPPSAQSGGGGGGGSNGAGGTASTAYPGSAGVGGGNPSAAGVDGSNASGAAGPNGTPAAGGNGGASPYGVGGAGGNGTEWDLAHGAGAGGGGAANFATPVGGGPGGNYGGGGGSGDNGFSGYGSPGLIVIAYSPLLTPPQGWLVVYETSGSPAIGSFAIRSNPQGGPGAEYLDLGQGTQHSFNLQLRQRGQAQYSLVVAATDSYAPTQFQPVFLYDQTSAGYTLVFSGILLDYTIRQIGINGDRYIDCNAASLEALLDTVYVTQSMQFVNQTCGSILTTLFNAFRDRRDHRARDHSERCFDPLVQRSDRRKTVGDFRPACHYERIRVGRQSADSAPLLSDSDDYSGSFFDHIVKSSVGFHQQQTDGKRLPQPAGRAPVLRRFFAFDGVFSGLEPTDHHTRKARETGSQRLRDVVDA